MLVLTFVADWPVDVRHAVEQVFAALQADRTTQLPSGTINLKLIDDAEIQRLNLQSAGKNEPTDVLTFSYQEDPHFDGTEIADIAISVETASRQAEASGTSLPDEVGLLALHGMLHTLGHDHQGRDEREAFDGYQQSLMEQAGLAYREFAWHD